MNLNVYNEYGALARTIADVACTEIKEGVLLVRDKLGGTRAAFAAGHWSAFIFVEAK